MSRANHDTAGRCRIALKFGTGQGFAVMGAAIFKSVQLTVQSSDSDKFAVHLGFKTTLTGELLDRARRYPARAHIIPVCRRAASDIID